MLIKGLLHVLFKRKKQILSFFIATLVVVIPLAMLADQPKYQSTAQMRLELGREFVSDLRLDTLGAVNPVVRFNPDEQLDLAIEILRGHSLAVKFVDQFGIERLFPNFNKPRWYEQYLPEMLRKERKPVSREVLLSAAAAEFIEDLGATKTPYSSIINIRYSHADPVVAAEATNLLVQLFVDRHLEIRRDVRTDQFFREQFDEIKSKLQAAEHKMRAFKLEHQISSTVDGEKDQLLAQINRLQLELNETLSKHSELETRIGQLRNQLANTARDPSAIAMLKERLLTLQIKESELAINYKSGSRTLDNLRGEISAVRAQLARAGGNKRYGSNGGSAGGAGSLYQKLQADLLKAETDLGAAAVRREVTTEQIGALKGRLSLLDGLDVEFSDLQQQVTVAKENHSLYLNRFEEMRISNAMDDEKISSISIIEPAREALEPMKSKLPLQVALAIAIGLIGGLGLAFLTEMLNKTVERREDIEDDFGIPVLASIPDFRTTKLLTSS